jgi:hypothetical protein
VTRRTCAGLETWIQEAAFDELDALAADPSRIPAPTPDWGTVHAFARVHDSKLYVLTLHLTHDEHRGVITLLGVRIFTVG